MSHLAEGPPEFAAAMRGYDRQQVDEYVAGMQQLLFDAEQRLRAADAEREHGAHATVGPRVTQIFELAIEETAELRARVRAESDERLADARHQAEELVAAARRDGEQIVAEARAQGEAAVAEQEGERELIRRQVEALEARKQHLVDELRRLQGALGSAADSVAGVHDEPPAWNDEGQTETMEVPLGVPPEEQAPPEAGR
jgi:hypothetical protein